jgi:hypothetical protein
MIKIMMMMIMPYKETGERNHLRRWEAGRGCQQRKDMSKAGKLFGTNKRCLTFRRRCLMMFEKEDQKTRSMSQASLPNEKQCRNILSTPPCPPPQHNKTSRYLVSPCLKSSTKIKVKLSL